MDVTGYVLASLLGGTVYAPAGCRGGGVGQGQRPTCNAGVLGGTHASTGTAVLTLSSAPLIQMHPQTMAARGAAPPGAAGRLAPSAGARAGSHGQQPHAATALHPVSAAAGLAGRPALHAGLPLHRGAPQPPSGCRGWLAAAAAARLPVQGPASAERAACLVLTAAAPAAPRPHFCRSTAAQTRLSTTAGRRCACWACFWRAATCSGGARAPVGAVGVGGWLAAAVIAVSDGRCSGPGSSSGSA